MNRRSLIIYSIISFVVATVVSALYVFNMQIILKSRTTANISVTTQETVKYINEFVDRNYKFIDSTIKSSSNSDIDLAKEIVLDLKDYGYYCAGYFNNNTDEYVAFKDNEELSNKFLYKYAGKKQTISQKVSIVKEKFILNNDVNDDIFVYTFLNDDKGFFVLQKASMMKDLLVEPYEGKEAYYLIAANDGLIINSNYSNESTTMMKVFNFTTSYLEFSNQFDEGQVTQVETSFSKHYYASKCSLISDYNTNDLNLYSLVEISFVKGVTKVALYATLIYVLVFIVLLSAYALFVFIQLSRVRKRLGREGIVIKDENHYSLLLDRNGRILSKNAKFSSLGLRNLGTLAKSMEILELNGEVDNFVELLKSRSEFNAKTQDVNGEEIIIKFLVIKNNFGYQLLGSDGKIVEGESIQSFSKENNNSLSNNYFGSDNESLFLDDLYDTYNKKALYIELKKIISEKAKNNPKTYLFYFGNSNEEEIKRTYGNQIEELLNATILKTVQSIIGSEVKIYNVDDHHFAFFYELEDTFHSLNKLMDNIEETMKKPAIVISNEIETELDFGIYHFASFGFNGATPKRLLEKAALSFKHALDLPKKTFKIYDANLDIAFSMDEVIANDIRNGLKNNEFVAYYQPNYSLKEDRVTGFECLLRWNNDKYRHDSPFRYIQVAEKVGLINDIGYFTLIESFKLMKELNDPSLHVSVNVSPAQFLQPGFIARLVSLYSLFEVPYECICIEITETFLIQSMNEVIEKLVYLRSYGIKIYLDDFGTGYSSLRYLAELPVDVIKIDKEFITPLKTSKSSRTIVSELIQIANELEIDIVAEGVEDDYQVSFLEKKKCNNIQGYYFSKPVSRDEVENALKIKRSNRRAK